MLGEYKSPRTLCGMNGPAGQEHRRFCAQSLPALGGLSTGHGVTGWYRTLALTAKKGLRGYPVATVALCVPDDTRATKLTLGLSASYGAFFR